MALLRPPVDSLVPQVVARVREMRLARRWSANRLAQELALLGYPVSREQLANLENNRRVLLSVDELAGFGAVFKVDPWSLTSPDRRCTRCFDSPPAGYSCTLCGNVGPIDDPISMALRLVGAEQEIADG